MSDSREFLAPWLQLKSDVHHRLPAVADIAGRPPRISAHLRAPLAHILPAVLAQTVNDRTPRFRQRLAHLRVNRGQRLPVVHLARAAPVVFQIVESPSPPRLRVLLL